MKWKPLLGIWILILVMIFPPGAAGQEDGDVVEIFGRKASAKGILVRLKEPDNAARVNEARQSLAV